MRPSAPKQRGMRPLVLLPAALLLTLATALAAYTLVLRDEPDTPVASAPPVPQRVGTTGAPELAAMVLQRRRYGIEADGLRLDERASGVVDNGARAAATLDPTDTAETLAAAGRRTGYDLSFLDTDLSSVVDGGVLEAGSSVDLFASGPSASAAILEEVVALELAESAGGRAAVDRASTFAVNGLEDALGFRVRLRVAGVPVWRTFVRFRHGALVGTASLTRSDATDVRADVVKLARSLDRRIAGVLDGTIAPVEPLSA